MWLLPERERIVPREHATLLQESDASGIARLEPLAPSRLVKRRAIARASGFQDREITTEVTAPGTHRVELAKSASVTARCVTIRNEPVADAVVAVSRDFVSRENTDFLAAELRDAIPGADPETATWLARSDAAGVAVLRDPPPEKYNIDVRHPSLVVVNDDVILGAEMSPSDPSAISGPSMGARAQAFERLRASMPQACVFVCAPTTPEPLVVTMRLLLEKAGLQEVRLEAVPLADPPVVTRLDSKSFRSQPRATGDAVVRILDEEGKPFPTFAPWRVEYELPSDGRERPRRGDWFSLSLRFGEPMRLPEGRYRVTSFSGMVHDRLSATEFTIRAGEQHRVDLVVRGTWVPCRVQTVTADGQPIGRTTVFLSDADRRSEFLPIEGGVRDLLLPAGKVSLKLSDGAYAAPTVEIEIAPQKDGKRQVLRIPCTRLAK